MVVWGLEGENAASCCWRQWHEKFPIINVMANTEKEMSYIEINLRQSTKEWLDWRMDGIGASDAACIMGENRFKSAEKLLREKHQRITPEINAAMAEGTRLEPEARRSYEKKQAIKVEPLCIQSSECSWMRASLDGIDAQRQTIVEIKCGKSAMREAQYGVIPDYYFGQLQHQLMVSGLDTIDYWCYRPEFGGVLLKMERDQDYINILLEKEEEFYKRMVAP